MWPSDAPAMAAIRSGWRPCLVLSSLGWIECLVLAALGLRPDAVLSTIAGPIGALSHDVTLAYALPIPLPLIAGLLGTAMAIRLAVYSRLTGWAWATWIRVWLIGIAVVTPIGVALVAFGLSGVPYLWAAAAVFACALTPAMSSVFGLRSWRWSFVAPGVATIVGALARLTSPSHALVVVALGVPLVAIASVHSFDPNPGPIRPWRALATVGMALGTVLLGTGLLYVLLQPSPVAPPDVQRQLEQAYQGDDPHRVILVDGFNTSRATLPWLGTHHPATWFSYAGLDHLGNPLPYRARDTLSGVLANVDMLAAQISLEDQRGPVTLVGISQGTWIIEATIHRHPELRTSIRQIVLIDTPLTINWIDIYAPNTHTGLELIAAMVRTVTPVRIDTQGPLARELTNGQLPSLAESTGIPTVWLRSVTDAATMTPVLSSDTTVVTYWGAHALTIGLPSGRDAVRRVIDGDIQSQPGSECAALVIRAIAAAWQLPAAY